MQTRGKQDLITIIDIYYYNVQGCFIATYHLSLFHLFVMNDLGGCLFFLYNFLTNIRVLP